MKKKLLACVCSLAIAFAFAGDSFATEVQSAPTFVLGQDAPDITQVIVGQDFAIFSFAWSDLASFTDYTPVFNNLSIRYNSSDGSNACYVDFKIGDSTPSMLYVQKSEGLYFRFFCPSQGICQIFSGTRSSVPVNPQGFNNSLSPSMSYGSTIIYDDNTVVGEVFNFSVPAGYALVIDGSCDISDRTYILSNSFDFPVGSTGLVNGSYERTLATPYTNVEGYQVDTPFDRSRMVQWSATNANWAGVASNYSYHATDVITLSSGNSYVFSYPQYYAYGPSDKYISYQNAVNLECSVYLEYSGTRPSARLVAIGSEGALQGGYFHYYNVFKPSVYNVTGSYTVGSDGQIVVDFNSTDTSGGVVTPPSGGGNTGQVPLDEGTDLLGTIKKFVNDIKSLLGSAVEGINELVSNGSSFMHSIAGMFEWLPSPVLSIIIAGFVVVLVVGVLKTLWR